MGPAERKQGGGGGGGAHRGLQQMPPGAVQLSHYSVDLSLELRVKGGLDGPGEVCVRHQLHG